MKKKLPIIIYYTFLIIYLELIYKGFVLHNLLSLNTLRIMLFSLSFICFSSLITSLFSIKVNKILSIILSSFITLIFISQYVYFKFYHSIYSIFSVLKGTEQVFGGFFSSIIIMIKNNIFVILIMLIPLVLFIIFKNKIFNFNKIKRNNIIYLISFFILVSFKFIYITLDKNELYSLNKLYYKTHAPMIMINKTGLLSMEVMDLERFIFGFDEKFDNKNLSSQIIIEDNANYNIINIDFDKLISEETNEDIISLHEYFKSVKPTNKNKYTGMFKGKNLIYITAESFDSIAIDKNLTPTLYKLVNNGFIFKNYYQPLYTVSTSDGEYMLMNSLIPKEGVWSFYESSFIKMPYGLGNIFKNLDYDVVNAYHDHTYKFYDRNLSHPNLGFKYTGCGNGLEKLMNCKSWPESDLEMIDATIDDYINSDNFMIYYMTVSGHLDYSFNSNDMSSKNKEYVKDLPYSKEVKAYLSANLELEKAITKLINVLEENGKLDDTVIVISPDHFPYGLTLDEMNEISKTNRKDKFENYHTSLIVYNSEMEENVIVDKYVSSIDVLPTIYNLFGIEYDSRLLMGKDALSDSDGLVILSDRSWINEKASYNSITDEFKKTENVTNDYLTKINNDIYNRFTVSSMLLYEKNGKYLDYYRRIGL